MEESDIYPAPIKKKSINPEMAKILKSSGFNLFKSSIIIPKDTNIDIDLAQIKNYDNQIKIFIDINRINEANINRTNESKINFVEDTFYNNILSTKENKNNFENIHRDINFKILKNEDRNNSSVFYPLDLISKLKGSEELDNIEKNINTQFNGLTKYQKENISIITSPYKFYEKYNDFNFYRKVKSNGNSFYISFMYQYFRNLIINHNDKEILYIFNIQKELNLINPINIKSELDMSTPNNFGMSYFNESLNKIDLNSNYISAFIYLYLIYQKTLDNQINEALYYLDYFSAYEESFVDLLCIFMRFKIKRFITINQDIFTYEKYCKRYKLISEEYFAEEDKLFQFEKYINENIIVNYMEPSLFIISIVPYIFNINLNLYINEKNTYNDINDNLCDKIVLNSVNSEETKINILYTSYSYHIIEMENTINSYSENEDISNIFNLTDNIDLIESEKNNYITFIDKDINEKCNKCKNTQFIRLRNISKNEICLNCLKKIIDEIFEQRYFNMLNDNFKYVEFYLRDIILKYIGEINKYVYLTSAEFYFLFNCNKFTYFRKLIGNICDACGNIPKNKKIINKKCGCKRCIECAKNEVNNNIVINEFEKAYVHKNKIIKCKCGKEIDEMEYGSQIWNMLGADEKDNLEIESKVRIRNYIQMYCMICGKKLKEIDKNKNKKELEIYNKYNFTNSNNEPITHLICEKCNKVLNKNISSIFCKICHQYHNNIDNYSINDFPKENKNNINENGSDNIINKKNNKNNLNENKNIGKSQKVKNNKYGKQVEKNVASKSVIVTNKININENTTENTNDKLNNKNYQKSNKKVKENGEKNKNKNKNENTNGNKEDNKGNKNDKNGNNKKGGTNGPEKIKEMKKKCLCIIF